VGGGPSGKAKAQAKAPGGKDKVKEAAEEAVPEEPWDHGDADRRIRLAEVERGHPGHPGLIRMNKNSIEKDVRSKPLSWCSGFFFCQRMVS
jgi:hypothetical protein